MAGMFYSLKEAAEKLGKTQDEVQQLADEGKLRVFRDGSNLLFKIDEVNALLAGGAEVLDMNLDAGDLEMGEAPAEEPLAEAFEEESAPTLDDSLEEDVFKLDDDDLAALEPTAEDGALAELDLPAMAEDDAASSLGLAADEADASSELDMTADSGEQEAVAQTSDDDIFLLDEAQSAAGSTAGTEEEISLAPESGMLAAESDITDMDTALAGEGVNVLGESGSGYDVTDDSMAETAGPAGSSAEASLEEIEDDVNLDSFGSGSGLLDLSLQADDTSLGGILDEIYTAEGGEEERALAASDEDQASFDEITAEADHAAPEEGMAMPEAVAVMPSAIGPVYAEAAPDTQSNMLGMLLFLPLLALLYTAIVAVAGLRNVTPSILSSIQGMVWYIMGGAIVFALAIVGASFVMGAEKAPRAPKEKKIKLEKTRKEKAPKAAKPAKEKKSFLAKRKYPRRDGRKATQGQVIRRVCTAHLQSFLPKQESRLFPSADYADFRRFSTTEGTENFSTADERRWTQISNREPAADNCFFNHE